MSTADTLRPDSPAEYEWPPVAAHNRNHAEESELWRLVHTLDRTVARIHALGIDTRKLRPDPVRPAAREVLAAYQQFLDIDEGGLEILRDALTGLQEALA